MKKALTRLSNGKYIGVLWWRVLTASIVTFATFNPWGESIVHWVMASEDKLSSTVILVVILTIAAHLAFLAAALMALGRTGSVIILIIIGAFIYWVFDHGWLTSSSTSVQFTALTAYALFLGVGAAGAIIWKRATGQVAIHETSDITAAEEC